MKTAVRSVPRIRVQEWVTCVALVCTGVLAVAAGRGSVLAIVLVLVCVASVALIAGHGTRWLRSGGPSRNVARPTLELLLHLSPVVLLTFTYPLASARLVGVQLGGTSLTSLLLASSLTVPWLSQAVCLPLYRAIGGLVQGGDPGQIERRLVETWPTTLLQCLPAIALFAVPVEFATRWSVPAFATYLALCVLHVVFAQSLVLANVCRRRTSWALAWAGYAAVLFAVPSAWFLPPLVGLATQLVPMRRSLGRLRHPVSLHLGDVVADVVRGLLLGAVLWADKFFFFLVEGPDFAVSTVFLGLLPAVLAYNYYFVRLAPGFDRSVSALHTAMQDESQAALALRSQALLGTVSSSIGRTGFVGAGLGLGLTLVLAELTPASLALAASVALTSWTFLMITVLCYKLDYIGHRATAQGLSGIHLLVCGAAFVLLPPGAVLYLALSGVELIVLTAALVSCLHHWRHAEYSLFWRHATAW